MRKVSTAAAIAASLALALSACGSDSEGGVSSEGSSSPLKIGTIASMSGPTSATFSSGPPALKARIEQYKADGGKCADRGFEFVEGDDASTPDGALKAAQKLVQSDKVDAVVNIGSFLFAASQFLTTQGKDTPVFSGGF